MPPPANCPIYTQDTSIFSKFGRARITSILDRHLGRLRGSFEYELDTKRSDIRKVCWRYDQIRTLFAALALGLVRHSALLPVGASLWLLRAASLAHNGPAWRDTETLNGPPGAPEMSAPHHVTVSTVTGTGRYLQGIFRILPRVVDSRAGRGAWPVGGSPIWL